MDEILKRRMWILTAVVGGTVYVALRLRGLTGSCLWFDEVFSVHAAGMDWGSMLSFVAKDIVHPPLSYILLKAWMVVDSSDITWLRLFPVVISTIALVPIALIVRDLKLNAAAAVTVYLFLAFNGTLIKYSQEVRMYALLFCLAAFSVWAFCKFFGMGKAFVLLVIINSLVVYTHYVGWLLVLSEVVVILTWQRIKTRRALLMLGINGLAFAPWAVYVWRVSSGVPGLAQNVGWIGRPGVADVIGSFADLVEPVYFQMSSVEPTTVVAVSVPVLLLTGCLIAAGALAWRGMTGDEKGRAFMLASLCVIPVAATLVVSLVMPFSFWGSRHLSFVILPFALLLGISVESVGSRRFQMIPPALVLVISGAALAMDMRRPQRELPWCGYSGLGASVDKWNGSAKYYLFEDLAAYQFWNEAKRLLPEQGIGNIFLVEDAEGMPEDKAYFLPRGFDGIARVKEDGIVDDEMFLVFAAESFDDTRPPLAKLRARGYRFEVADMKEIGGLKVIKIKARREGAP